MPAEAHPDMTLPGNRRSKTVLTPAMVVEVTRQSTTSEQSALSLKTTTAAKQPLCGPTIYSKIMWRKITLHLVLNSSLDVKMPSTAPGQLRTNRSALSAWDQVPRKGSWCTAG